MSKVIDKILMEQEDMVIELLARELYDDIVGVIDFEQVKTIAKKAYIEYRDQILKEMKERILYGEGTKEPLGLLGGKK